MNLGLSTFFFVNEKLGTQHLSLVKEAGIEKIEVMHHPSHFKYDDVEQVSFVAKEAKNLGIKIVSMHAPGEWMGGERWDLSCPSNQWAIYEAKKVIDTLELLGGSILVIHLKVERLNDGEQRLVSLHHNIAEIVEYCEKKNIILGVENVTPEALSFVSRFNTRNIGIVLDTHHTVSFVDHIYPPLPSLLKTIKKCDDKLIYVHANDVIKISERNIKSLMHYPGVADKAKEYVERGKIVVHLLPYDGIIDWKVIAQTLEENRYKGIFLIEPCPVFPQFRKKILKMMTKRFKRCKALEG